MTKIRGLLGLIFLSLIAILLLAAPVFAYLYRAPLTIVESASTTYTMLPVMVTVGNQWMVDNGFMATDTLDTRVETLGGAVRPHMVADDRTLTAVAVPADSQTNLFFSTGNSDLTALDIITGYGGYLTVSDVAGLEPGNNFVIEQSGYIDTSAGSDKSLVLKASAFKTYIQGAGSIRSAILSSGAPVDVTLRPDGIGSYTNIASVFGAPTHWEAVDAVDDTTYVYTSSTSTEKDAYSLEDGSIPADSTINSVTVYFRFGASANVDSWARPFLRLGTDETTGTEDIHTVSSYATESEVLARPGGGSWLASDIPDLQVSVGIRVESGYTVELPEIKIVVNYSPAVEDVFVTATGVSSGKHIVKTTADTTNLKIFIDGVEEDSVALAGASVPDNAHDWILMSLATPYWDYYKHTVGGALVTRYEPSTMIIGITLPDREAAANDATITWGANPVGVSVSLGSMASSGQASIGVAVTEPPRDILPTVATSDWFGDGTVSGSTLTNPFRPFITMVSDNTTLNEIQVWRWMGLALWLFATVATSRILRGHMGITSIIASAVLGALVAFDHNIFPFWLLIITIGGLIGGVIAERSPSL